MSHNLFVGVPCWLLECYRYAVHDWLLEWNRVLIHGYLLGGGCWNFTPYHDKLRMQSCMRLVARMLLACHVVHDRLRMQRCTWLVARMLLACHAVHDRLQMQRCTWLVARMLLACHAVHDWLPDWWMRSHVPHPGGILNIPALGSPRLMWYIGICLINSNWSAVKLELVSPGFSP
jgi:hypothetical protein